MDRRTFMQMLGIGGLATGIAPPISLFGSYDAPDELCIPDPNLVGQHFIVQPRQLIEPVHRVSSGQDGVVVARINSRAPNMRSRLGALVATMDMQRKTLSEAVEIDLDIATVETTHVAYYLAAHRLRQRFTDYTREVTRPYGNYTTIVTVIDAPIKFLRGSPRHVYADAAFQMYVLNGARSNVVAHFDVCSESGQYPIDAPSDVEIGRLLHLDREVVASGGRVDGILQRLLRRTT
jgi:hypothetical protein